MTPPETITIGQLAREAGINTSAIRYYEAVGLLLLDLSTDDERGRHRVRPR